jgi:hypothetical protein
VGAEEEDGEEERNAISIATNINNKDSHPEHSTKTAGHTKE